VSEESKTGFWEVLGIAALLLFIWKLTHKDKILKVAGDPVVIDADKELNRPDFNLNKYCKNVVARPLSNTGITSDSLHGAGWCSKGDGSLLAGKPTGDVYAKYQSDQYQQRKQTEANLINNKSVLQFRLINSTNAPITTDVLNTTTDPNVINGSSDMTKVPNPPQATPANNILSTSFDATWQPVAGASGYYLYVATDAGFSSMVPGYNGLDVGNVVNENVSGLTAGTQYFYKTVAYNVVGASGDSNTISVTTKTSYNDFFLASKNELLKMWTNLWSGTDEFFNPYTPVGNFINGYYWSSSEYTAPATLGETIDFTDGTNYQSSKGVVNYVRACRKFTAAPGAYSLRSIGPAGGLIFYISGSTYYEAAPQDQDAAMFSNITTALGTTSPNIGQGLSNTNKIIAQPGHITSAAKTCVDLIVYN
jgi:hypothetical protein